VEKWRAKMLDSQEGFYPDDDSDLTEGIGSRFGLCSMCGKYGYLFGKIEIVIDDEGHFEGNDICTECACDVVNEFQSTGEEVEN
jgi:hypothetical protein